MLGKMLSALLWNVPVPSMETPETGARLEIKKPTFLQSQGCPSIPEFPRQDTQLHSRNLLPHHQVSFPEGEKMLPHCLISQWPPKAALDAQI